MKQYTITIPDEKENSFIDMMKSISYIKDIEENISMEISEKHKQVVRERIKKHALESYLDWKEIERNIKLD